MSTVCVFRKHVLLAAQDGVVQITTRRREEETKLRERLNSEKVFGRWLRLRHRTIEEVDAIVEAVPEIKKVHAGAWVFVLRMARSANMCATSRMNVPHDDVSALRTWLTDEHRMLVDKELAEERI